MSSDTDPHSKRDIAARIARLSPGKRALLYEHLSRSGSAPEAGRLGAERPLLATPIVALSRSGNLPLSFAQQRLWFLDRLLHDKAAYNIPAAWRLNGPLDVPALERSLSALVARHETLRTRFVASDGEPVQFIDAPYALTLPLVDLSAMEKSEREVHERRIADAHAHEPFDLETGPLMRAQLVRLAPEQHLLLLNVHHIASDGWSMSVFNRELSLIYGACVSGKDPQLPPLPIQYADYAAWQREWLQGGVLDSQLGYWKSQLADISTLELPVDRPRPPLASARGAHLTFNVPAPLTAALKVLGGRDGATLFMTLLAAFNVLLYRYSGQENIAVGSPIAGRTRAELESLIGFFVNTVVLRTDLSGNPAFRELLGRVRENALEAYTCQDLPFEKLVEELAPARDMSRNPLFQVMFVLQNTPDTTLTLEGVQASPAQFAGHSAKFDLTLSVRESAQGLHTRWEYATDLFDGSTIQRMAQHFERLLEAIVADPGQRIGELPLLGQSERHQLLVEWNDTAADYPRDRCIHQLFEDQVARTPDAVAVVFEDRQLTYAELNARANQLAHHLDDLGVKPEVLVGVCMERSLELIVALLGVLKAGGAYVPLDPSYPTSRLAFMLKDAAAPVLLTQQMLVEQLPPYEGRILCLDRDWRDVGAHSRTNPANSATAESLAYVMYTSGSTGRPKGVAVPHRGVLRLLLGNDYIQFGRQQTFLMLSPVSFDASTFELWGALLHGARCAIFRERVPTIDVLGEALQRYRVSTLWLTAALFNLIVDEAPQILSGVRQLLTGGEALSPSHVRDAMKRLPGVQLINGYGPTESTTFACCYAIPNTLEPTRISVPIGRPIANTRIYLLDRSLNPVPLGAPGELWIGGDGLARGYLNRPELTAEKFLPDPFSEVAGARMYRTGDRARYLADGNIEFLGRIDDQVKIRGFRIEPGEIEAVLAEHPAVRQAVVAARGDTPGERHLIAYVVPADASLDGSETLRAFLRERLPDYMQPAAYVVLERLPLMPSGKIDRGALPAPQYERTARAGASVPARNALEEVVAEVWREVLKLERVGVHDNFFELGGHSLLAAQIVARLAKLLHVELPLRRIFETPTISGVAAEAEKMLGAGDVRRSAPIAALPRTSDLPLSFAQQRLWLLDRLLPDKAAYNIPTAWRLTGPLDVPALERSLDALVARHEALRTRFAVREGRPAQVVDAPRPVALPVTDLSALPDGEREARALELVDTETHHPFDLEAGPLLRTQLLRLAPDEHLLLVNVHHILSDGWSMGILERELSDGYNAVASNRAPRLSELPIQYADYAAWQRRWLQGEVLESQLDYWKTRLAGLSTLELPADRPRLPVTSYNGARLGFDVPEPLTRSVKALGRREGATLFMTLLAAFEALLYRYSGQDDIAIGVPIAGRRHSELEGLIGFFVNTLVLRTDLSGNPSFRELLARVRECALGAYMHQDLPFEKLVEELAPVRELARNPLFQVMFVLQNAPVATLALGGVQARRERLESHTAKFDLTLSVTESNDGLHCTWEWCTDLFDASTIQRIARHFERVLEGAVADAEQRIAELPLLTAAEHHQLLVEWNDTSAAYPANRCIHELFEDQAARTPDAVATIFEGRQLTYAEVNERADELARQLTGLGVGPEVLVGLCMERSLEAIIGSLAILKSGAAYVPLDPAHPKDRLAFMLTDTGAPVLLTQPALLGRLPFYEGRIVCLARDGRQIDAHGDRERPIAIGHAERRAARVTGSSPAYVIYTSGSTGVPKGVVGLHRGIANRLSWMSKTFPWKPGEVACQRASLSFVDSVCEMFGPLLQGAPLVVLSEECARDPHRLVEALSQRKATRIVLVPSLLRALLETYDDLGDRLLALTLWVSSGEPLVPELVRRFRKQLPRARLLNLYGASEVSADVTWHDTAETASHGSVPIGRPIANTRIYILDRTGQPAPVGVPGELHVAGAGLARGYLNRAELTAERFLRDPFSVEPAARMYRTGDLARYLADGNIEYLGRIDDQVKIRGMRIELGEIEAVLAAHPAVSAAVVRAREDTPGEPRLVAYVVPADASFNSGEPLRTWLRERLPEYMQPLAYVTLTRVPLTPSGKIDRAALPAPQYAGEPSASAFVPPRGEREAAIGALWRELLNVERVGRHDNFFDLGGHSLLAARMVARVGEACGCTVPLRWIFEGPTLAELAARIESPGPHDAQTESTCAVAIQPHGRRRPVFFVPGFGGAILPFQALSREMGSEQPLYVLDFDSALGALRSATVNVENLAAQMLESMRRIQPHGPYNVAGYSLGGRFAWEIAQQLLRDREEVGLLALLDCSAPGYPRTRTFALRAVSHIKYALSLDQHESLHYLAERFLKLKKYFRRAPARTYPQVFDDAGIQTEAARAIQGSAQVIYDAARAHIPALYPGRITLVRAELRNLAPGVVDDDPLMGWGKLAGNGVDLARLDCAHHEMLEAEHAKTLAGVLNERLRVCECRATDESFAAPASP